MKKAVLWSCGGVLVVVCGLVVYRWHGYTARREIAALLADALSPSLENGETKLFWYPHDSMSPLVARDLRYCGVGTMRMASRGMADLLGCAETHSACLAESVNVITPCNHVEVAIIDQGEPAGTPRQPLCSGGFFTARVVCVVRQEADGASVVFRITVSELETPR